MDPYHETTASDSSTRGEGASARHPQVDEMLSILATVGELPLQEQVRVFDEVHEGLRSALATATDQAHAGLRVNPPRSGS